MGKKGKWFGAVKKAFSPEENENKQKNHKSRKKWKFGKSKISDPTPSAEDGIEDAEAQSASPQPKPIKQIPPAAEVKQSSPVTEASMPSPVVEIRPTSPLLEVKLPSPDPEVKLHSPPTEIDRSLPVEEVKHPRPNIEFRLHPSSVEVKPLSAIEFKLKTMDDEQAKHAYSVALASAVAAEAAAVAAQAAAEVVRLTTSSRVSNKPRGEIAATMIQAAFRGYLARKTLRTLKGLDRLKKLVDEDVIKRGTTKALHSMHTFSRVQAQIQARRKRMKEENQALQMQLMLKQQKDQEKIKIEGDWDDSLDSKEKIEAKILNRREATIRRERALAYAFSHQWKSSSKAMTPMFSDSNDVQWGWSWLECWMAVRPWENHCSAESNIGASKKTVSHTPERPTVKILTPRDSSLECNLTAAHRPNSSDQSVPSTPPQPSSISGKKKPASPKVEWVSFDSDSRSIASTASQKSRSLSSSPSIPNYMSSTKSARAKSRSTSLHSDQLASEKGSISTAKKHLSFPTLDKQSMSSPARPRRYSGPPRVDVHRVD